jgi:Zn finger protein HypA/HybF involved in hydrogenase expression
MIDLTCKHCKQEVSVAMYYFNAKILTHENAHVAGEQHYEAVVSGKAICPKCGKEIIEIFKDDISTGAIIKLARAKRLHPF